MDVTELVLRRSNIAGFALAASACLFAQSATAAPSTAPTDTGPAGRSLSALARPEPVTPPRALALPFAPTAEPDPDWLSTGIAAFLSEAMAATGHRIVEPEERLDALEEAGLDDEPQVPLAAGCALARQLGARYLVSGTWEARGTRVSIVGRVYDVERLKLVRESTSAGQAGTLGSLLGSLALDLTGAAGREPRAHAALDSLASASSAALAAWMQATAEPDLAPQHLAAALEASPQFVPAMLALADSHLDAGRPELVAPLLAQLPATASLQQHARSAALRGRALLATGNARAAVDMLTDAVSAWPEREPLLWLGEAQLASADRAGAALTAKRLLEQVAEDQDALDLQRRASGQSADPPL